MAKKTKKNREHLDHFNIAGFTYYDGPEAFAQLKIGVKLELVLEEDNAYDNRAVMIWYKDFHLGYIPMANNRIFYKLLKTGSKNIDVRIQRLDAASNPEHQVDVVAHLVGKEIDNFL